MDLQISYAYYTLNTFQFSFLLDLEYCLHQVHPIFFFWLALVLAHLFGFYRSLTLYICIPKVMQDDLAGVRMQIVFTLVTGLYLQQYNTICVPTSSRTSHLLLECIQCNFEYVSCNLECFQCNTIHFSVKRRI